MRGQDLFKISIALIVFFLVLSTAHSKQTTTMQWDKPSSFETSIGQEKGIETTMKWDTPKTFLVSRSQPKQSFSAIPTEQELGEK